MPHAKRTREQTKRNTDGDNELEQTWQRTNSHTEHHSMNNCRAAASYYEFYDPWEGSLLEKNKTDLLFRARVLKEIEPCDVPRRT
jgi:hypothetical protein